MKEKAKREKKVGKDSGKKNVELLDGNLAAAWGVKLCRVECVPAFPITPQTEMMEELAKWVVRKKIDIEFTQLESEHSVISSALGSEMTGARTFTATSSQGIMLMHEVLPIVAGTRMPMVMVNGSRAVSAPIALWPDHNDFLAMRDSGWLMFMAETNQELLDSIIIAFRVSENKKVLLPSLVGMDGYILSYTREEVKAPKQSLVDKFLPRLRLETKLDVKKPMTLGTPVLHEYMEFKAQMHRAQQNAVKEIEKAHKEWARLTGRKYGFLEEVNTKGAKAVLVMMGANTSIAKAAVKRMRKKGKKVGLVKLRVIRPFPEKWLKKALKGAKSVGVADQNIAPGLGGILYPEVKAALAGEKKIVSSYVFGLGGKMVSVEDFGQVFEDLLKGKKEARKWLV